MPFMPVALNTGISYFDGPRIVSCAGLAVHNRKLTEPIDGIRSVLEYGSRACC